MNERLLVQESQKFLQVSKSAGYDLADGKKSFLEAFKVNKELQREKRKFEVMSSFFHPKSRSRKMFFKSLPNLIVINDLYKEYGDEIMPTINEVFAPFSNMNMEEFSPIIDEVTQEIMNEMFNPDERDKIRAHNKLIINSMCRYGYEIINYKGQEINLAQRTKDALEMLLI